MAWLKLDNGELNLAMIKYPEDASCKEIFLCFSPNQILILTQTCASVQNVMNFLCNRSCSHELVCERAPGLFLWLKNPIRADFQNDPISENCRNHSLIFEFIRTPSQFQCSLGYYMCLEFHLVLF